MANKKLRKLVVLYKFLFRIVSTKLPTIINQCIPKIF